MDWLSSDMWFSWLILGALGYCIASMVVVEIMRGEDE